MGGTDMPAYMWPLITVLALILGLLIGGFIGHRSTTAYRHAQAAERELRRLREEQARYRQRVKEHFVTTAELINRMTDAYREVFRHLVASSQELCGPDAPKLVPTEPVGRELLEHQQDEAARQREAAGRGEAAKEAQAGGDAQQQEAAAETARKEATESPAAEAGGEAPGAGEEAAGEQRPAQEGTERGGEAGQEGRRPDEEGAAGQEAAEKPAEAGRKEG